MRKYQDVYGKSYAGDGSSNVTSLTSCKLITQSSHCPCYFEGNCGDEEEAEIEEIDLQIFYAFTCHVLIQSSYLNVCYVIFHCLFFTDRHVQCDTI